MGRGGGRVADDIWPLHLLDLKDDTHMSVAYNLLKDQAKVIEYYLDHGLPQQFDGVVFLDHKDRKKILMLHDMIIVMLQQSPSMCFGLAHRE
jgi:hypothetical protein